MEKEGKVMIFSYVKGLNQQQDVKKLVEGNKEQNMGATTKEHLKEKKMGVWHSHNAFCGCMFSRNVTDGVKDVSIHETSKGGAKK